MFNITGIVKVKKDVQQITDSFKKREFVITEASGNYPQDILFELTQERTGLIDDVNVNDTVTVTFSIRGREWTNPEGEVKYFNSLNAWRIEKGNTGGGGTAFASNQDITPKSSDSAETLIDESEDDLPF